MVSSASKRRVSEVMTEEVATLGAHLSVAEAVRHLANNRVSGMPVTDASGVVVGVVSLTDIASLLGARAPATVETEEPSTFYDSVRLLRLVDQLLHNASTAEKTVKDIMSTQLVYVRPSDSIGQAARLMTKRRVHRLLVLDERGQLAGIVSALDLVSLLTPEE